LIEPVLIDAPVFGYTVKLFKPALVMYITCPGEATGNNTP